MYFFPKRAKRTRGRHRRRRTLWWHRFSEYLWPSIGWRSYLRHSELKLKRTKGSAHLLALGFACGAFVSFTPFIGTHLLFVGFCTLLFRANFISGWIGTLVGNPWTFPFIWIWCYELGNFLLGVHSPAPLPDFSDMTFQKLWDNLQYYWDNYLWPMCVGGVPSGLIAGLVFYFLLRYNIEKFQAYRRHRIAERRKFWSKVKMVSTATAKEKAQAITENIKESVKDKVLNLKSDKKEDV